MTKIFVPKELDGQLGRAVFSVAHRDPLASIHWHLDQNFIGTTTEIHEKELSPKPGVHTLTLVDDEGQILSRSFTVIDK